jgi:hypothetical protein
MLMRKTNHDSPAPCPADKAGYGPADRHKGVLNVNKALGLLVRGALVAGVVLLSASAGWAAIDGKVIDDVGFGVPGATVEVWDAYPGGTILTSGTTDGSGLFSLGSVAPTHFDLRVRKATGGKPQYYPAVIRNLPDPITNVVAILYPLGTTLSSPNVSDYWDSSSSFLGTQLLPGDILEAFDPDGVLCGLAISSGSGDFLIHVIGDDALGGAHEGPFVGDTVKFKINGFPATPPVVFSLLASDQHNLVGATNSDGVTVVGPADAGGAEGEQALISYQVTNSGAVTDSFNLDAFLPEGWLITFPVSKLPSITLAPGASTSIGILVSVPPGVGDTAVTVTFDARSRTYGFVAAGSFTRLSVTHTGVWDGGDGGLLPKGFALAQNYPNPFNPSTEIAFSLRVGGHVRLDVFNLLGQSVAVLADGYRPQGISVVTWDGRDAHGAVVPTGIYFYRLAQNGQSLVRKMVLLK